MTRPEEAAGLTAALARSIDLKAADLSILIGDDNYRAELARRGLTSQANAAQIALFHAERALRAIANALAAPAAAAAPPRIEI